MAGVSEPIRTSEYAARREASRMHQVLVMGAFVLVLGLVVGLQLHGLWRIAVWIAAVLILAFFALSMLRRVQPSEMTRVTARVQPGSWPASIRIADAPIAAKPRRANLDSTLPGHVQFTENGVAWAPNPPAAKTFGVGPHTWDSTCSIAARRLRGLGNQVQVDLIEPDGHIVTLWMRHGASFTIR